MTTGPPTWPAPLGQVRIPELLSPSALADAASCPLPMMVGAPDDWGTLPPTPVAILGTTLHHVRALWRTRADDAAEDGREAADAVDALLSATVDVVQRELRADPRTRSLVPLHAAVGHEVYLDRRMALRRWARAGVPRLDVEGPGGLDLRLFHGASDTGSPDHFDLGVEPWLVDNALRLRGRPDLIVRAPDGALEISDDKTGHLVDDKGQVLERHVTQLGLYALIVEHLLPGVQVRLRVVGEIAHEIRWDAPARAKVKAQLEEFRERLPAGEHMTADTLASPGASCPRCRLRPRCQAYRTAAMAWWQGRADPPRPVPFDTWGIVDDVEQTAEGIDLMLTDVVGRVVRVRGLDEVHGLTPEHIGSEVAVFNLQPTQDVRLHGRWLAPTSWHERSPGRTYPSAMGTRVFSGQRER